MRKIILLGILSLSSLTLTACATNSLQQNIQNAQNKIAGKSSNTTIQSSDSTGASSKSTSIYQNNETESSTGESSEQASSNASETQNLAFNFVEISAGDYESANGTWENADGGVLTISENSISGTDAANGDKVSILGLCETASNISFYYQVGSDSCTPVNPHDGNLQQSIGAGITLSFVKTYETKLGTAKMVLVPNQLYWHNTQGVGGTAGPNGVFHKVN